MWGDGPRVARGARVGRCALFQESRVSGITGPGLKSAGRARTFQNINSARPRCERDAMYGVGVNFANCPQIDACFDRNLGSFFACFDGL